MSIFLLDYERDLIVENYHREPLNRFYSSLVYRTHDRAKSPGLTDRKATNEWWYHAAEYVTEASMAYALEPDEVLSNWLRDVVLSIVRRPVDDWVGPWFRDHDKTPPIGNLETSHLCLAVAAALGLAPDVFYETEKDEIKDVLRERGIPLCLQWLESNTRMNNWRCIMTCGLAVSAAVLNDRVMMQRAVKEFQLCTLAFQPDGSYSESLQYGNYAAYGLMLAYEALVRCDPKYADDLPVEAYARGVRWSAYSFFYNKPLSKWGAYPRPRSANFNDSAAMHRPSADLLLHIAVRPKDMLPLEAGLARWLFDVLYLPFTGAGQGPFHVSSFSFYNQFGFLTLPLLLQAAEPLSPTDAQLPPVASFSNGDCFVRDKWGGSTILAIRSGKDPLNGPAHLHGDLNSFILVYNRERLLVDSGHSCYRNLMRTLECDSQSHNTCTFMVSDLADDVRQEDILTAKILQQRNQFRRDIVDGNPLPPVDRGGHTLLIARKGQVTVIASQAAKLYGPPIENFTRFWFLLGAHVLIVVDHIESAKPVITTWNWLLNNRDDSLELTVHKPDRLFMQRGDSGMHLSHFGHGILTGPIYGYVHDCYDPLPNQRGEGKPGSGLIFRWREREARLTRTVAHVIAMDNYGAIAGWNVDQDDEQIQCRGCGGNPDWNFRLQEEPLVFHVIEATNGEAFRVDQADNGEWNFSVC